MDELAIKKLDKVTMRQRLFLQIEGPNNSTDYTILPFEMKIQFYIGFKQGLRSDLGPVPDIAVKFGSAEVEVLECENVENPFRSQVNQVSGDSDEGDDDDFDEDDEDDQNS